MGYRVHPRRDAIYRALIHCAFSRRRRDKSRLYPRFIRVHSWLNWLLRFVPGLVRELLHNEALRPTVAELAAIGQGERIAGRA